MCCFHRNESKERRKKGYSKNSGCLYGRVYIFLSFFLSFLCMKKPSIWLYPFFFPFFLPSHISNLTFCYILSSFFFRFLPYERNSDLLIYPSSFLPMKATLNLVISFLPSLLKETRNLGYIFPSFFFLPSFFIHEKSLNLVISFLPSCPNSGFLSVRKG